MLAVPGCVPESEEYHRHFRSSFSPPPVAELFLASDNKDPLRKESVSPDIGENEALTMWMVSEDTNK